MLWKGILVKTLAVFYTLQSIFNGSTASTVTSSETSNESQLSTTRSIFLSNEITETTVSSFDSAKIVPTSEYEHITQDDNFNILVTQPEFDIQSLINDTEWLNGANAIGKNSALATFEEYVLRLHDESMAITRSGQSSYVVTGNIPQNPYFGAVTRDSNIKIFMGTPVIFSDDIRAMLSRYFDSVKACAKSGKFRSILYPSKFTILINNSIAQRMTNLSFERLIKFITHSRRNNIDVKFGKDIKTFHCAKIVFKSGNEELLLYPTISEEYLNDLRTAKAQNQYIQVSYMEWIISENMETVTPTIFY